MFIETVKVVGLANSSYVMGSEQSGQCAVIDPGAGRRPVHHHSVQSRRAHILCAGITSSQRLYIWGQRIVRPDRLSGGRQRFRRHSISCGAPPRWGRVRPGGVQAKSPPYPGTHARAHLISGRRTRRANRDIHRRCIDYGRRGSGGPAGEQGRSVPGPVATRDDPR